MLITGIQHDHLPFHRADQCDQATCQTHVYPEVKSLEKHALIGDGNCVALKWINGIKKARFHAQHVQRSEKALFPALATLDCIR